MFEVFLDKNFTTLFQALSNCRKAMWNKSLNMDKTAIRDDFSALQSNLIDCAKTEKF